MTQPRRHVFCLSALALSVALLTFRCASTGASGAPATTTNAPSVVFEDTFDSENGQAGALNYAGFAQWEVSDGTVDLIGTGFHDLQPGNGLYVDLDGSSNDAGVMECAPPLALPAGSYELHFRMAGSQRSEDADTCTVSVGDVLRHTHVCQPADPFAAVTHTFDITDDTQAVIRFEHNGGDNRGVLIDDVKLLRM